MDKEKQVNRFGLAAAPVVLMLLLSGCTAISQGVNSAKSPEIATLEESDKTATESASSQLYSADTTQIYNAYISSTVEEIDEAARPQNK